MWTERRRALERIAGQVRAMSAADDIAREVDQDIFRRLRDAGPVFPCPSCGKETKVQTTGTRICCIPSCRTVVDTKRTATVFIELLATDGMVVAAVQFDQWIAVTPTEAVNAYNVVFNRMFPGDDHQCHAFRVHHDGTTREVLLPQVLGVSSGAGVGFQPGAIGMKFAPLDALVKPAPVQPALQDFQEGLEPAQVEKPAPADDMRWKSTNEFAWEE